MDLVVKVVFTLPVDISFSYKLDSQLLNDYPIIGRRVLAELGKKKATGYIIDFDNEYNNEKLKYIEEVLDEKPVLSENLIKLTKWISDYYLCSIGESIKATLPQGFSPKSLLKIELKRIPTEDEFNQISKKAPRRAELLNFLLLHKKPLSISYLQKELNSNYVGTQIEALERAGYIEVHSTIEKGIGKKKIKGYSIPDEILSKESEIQKISSSLDNLKGKHSLIFLKINSNLKNKNLPTSVIELKKAKLYNANTINYLKHNGFIIETDIEISRMKFEDSNNLSVLDESELPLTEEQMMALNSIDDAINNGSFMAFLLHGVTGSGKTLIYIHTIKKVLARNKTALLLVPEISLTPQLIDRFHRVFPDELAVQHSRMSEGERYDNWKSIADHKSKVVIGARSAIFAPLQNIGVIIIDEEHEPSYKQDNPAPRYNARDVAIVRAKDENAVVILGSATPSLESMYNAKIGKYELLKIENRADKAKLPVFNVVNTLIERKNKLLKGSFSSQLVEKINDRVDKKEGIILFLNRRGFASYLFCPDCGNVPMCKNCSVTLTYHKVRNYLRCHYCGFATEAYRNCPVCGFPELIEIGSGTQKVEEELKQILEEHHRTAVIDRIDLDSISKKDSLRKKLYDFYKGKINILVGTQMLAKGIDFEIVTLVGVINPDIQLFLPDFRASERTFQLITQVAGRAGRTGEKPGEVILQTSHPNMHSIANSVENNYYKFFEEEIENRKLANYPPFSRFIIIEFLGKDEKKVINQAKIFRELLPPSLQFAEILGPVSPTIFRVNMNYRQQIVIKDIKKYDPQGLKIRSLLKKTIDTYNKKHSNKSIKLIVDIDSYRSI